MNYPRAQLDSLPRHIRTLMVSPMRSALPHGSVISAIPNRGVAFRVASLTMTARGQAQVSLDCSSGVMCAASLCPYIPYLPPSEPTFNFSQLASQSKEINYNTQRLPVIHNVFSGIW